jgi:hypothetical protein
MHRFLQFPFANRHIGSTYRISLTMSGCIHTERLPIFPDSVCTNG